MLPPRALLGLLCFVLVVGSAGVSADDPPPAPPVAEPPAPVPPAEPGPPPPAPPEEPPAAKPDVVLLDNGSSFEGTIVEEDASRVVLEVTSSTGGLSRVTIERSRVREIRRGDGREAPLPATVVQREAWFVLYSGGEPVGTRHEVLKTLRVDGQAGFRLEETVVQLPQGRRIRRARYERVEDTDLRFLPRRMHYRESVDPGGDEPGLARYERSVSGRVEGDVWRATWRRGSEIGNDEVPLPSETRGLLGLREHLLRAERAPGLARTVALDGAEGRLVDLEAGYAAVAKDTGGTDELHWVTGGTRRITRLRGLDVVEDQVAEGVTAVQVTQAQAQAVEQGARAQAKDASSREVKLVEPALAITLPGADWTVKLPTASALDTGRRELALLSSTILLAHVRVEWDPEPLGPAATAAAVEAALLARLRDVCPDLRVIESRAPEPRLPGAFRLGVTGTLRATPVRTRILVVPRGKGLVYFLAALPEASWEAGRPALDDLLASVRPF